MITTLNVQNIDETVEMALDLWPGHTFEQMKSEFDSMLGSVKAKVFVYGIENKSVGFLHMSLRSDYVEGSTSSPVAYVEGVYVKQDYRTKGVAKELLKEGEEWAKINGCSQIASDIEQGNEDSYQFHHKSGFSEANRIICFIKDLHL
ncbi:GNAT family N-acetyltransferase [Radiobacillus kanasensis]|uniref:aminoglycoside 6'-N-acetyltransferase n=1 Tax=Radiobacillus kanasensis TaxID=2844358 RepID=UPI001E5A0A96|nr:aminoglycoside 6'-N-acetyltransferase [Radiobacillus kanasensis]UFU00733.1 GNAT family N-acetyltransferase [Radiobacillus kanasensis]